MPDVGQVAVTAAVRSISFKEAPTAAARRPGIVQGAPGGAEAGHGDRLDLRAGAAQPIIGPRRHQQRQGGIEAPRQADHRAGVGVRQPPGKAGGLDGEDFLAAGRLLVRVVRDKGTGGENAGQLEGADRMGEGDDRHVLLCREGGHPPPLKGELVEIHLRGDDASGKTAAFL